MEILLLHGKYKNYGNVSNNRKRSLFTCCKTYPWPVGGFNKPHSKAKQIIANTWYCRAAALHDPWPKASTKVTRKLPHLHIPIPHNQIRTPPHTYIHGNPIISAIDHLSLEYSFYFILLVVTSLVTVWQFDNRIGFSTRNWNKQRGALGLFIITFPALRLDHGLVVSCEPVCLWNMDWITSCNNHHHHPEHKH